MDDVLLDLIMVPWMLFKNLCYPEISKKSEAFKKCNKEMQCLKKKTEEEFAKIEGQEKEKENALKIFQPNNILTQFEPDWLSQWKKYAPLPVFGKIENEQKS